MSRCGWRVEASGGCRAGRRPGEQKNGATGMADRGTGQGQEHNGAGTDAVAGAIRDLFDHDYTGAQIAQELESAFTTVFRGYDRDEVAQIVGALAVRLRSQENEISRLKGQAAHLQDARSQMEKLRHEADDLRDAASAADARAAAARADVEALAAELSENAPDDEDSQRERFGRILRVAEEQAATLVTQASERADALRKSAQEEVAEQRARLQHDADAVRSQAHAEAEQLLMRARTDATALQTEASQKTAQAAQALAQAEQEAAAVRTAADKETAALRAAATSESAQARADAEATLRDVQQRTAQFEQALTRRRDDAQQEFLDLHNEAVAHAERITQDANAQVTAALAHAKQMTAKADDYYRLMHAQAQQVHADAVVRARERLDKARDRARRTIEAVTAHTRSVLQDAEDRARALRWQQRQLDAFVGEITDLTTLQESALGELDDDDIALPDAGAADVDGAAAGHSAGEPTDADDVAAGEASAPHDEADAADGEAQPDDESAVSDDEAQPDDESAGDGDSLGDAADAVDAGDDELGDAATVPVAVHAGDTDGDDSDVDDEAESVDARR